MITPTNLLEKAEIRGIALSFTPEVAAIWKVT